MSKSLPTVVMVVGPLVGEVQLHQTDRLAVVLVKWFGSPYLRVMKADGRAEMSWSFAPPPPGLSGSLAVNLAPNGKVESYSARWCPD